LEAAAVDGDDSHAGAEAGFVGEAAYDDVGDATVGGGYEAEGVEGVYDALLAFEELVPVGGLVGVGELVAAKGVDAVDLRGVESVGVEALVEEGGPVVGDNGVEGGNDVFEGVGDDDGAGVAVETFEGGGEVIEALFVVGFGADG